MPCCGGLLYGYHRSSALGAFGRAVFGRWTGDNPLRISWDPPSEGLIDLYN